MAGCVLAMDRAMQSYSHPAGTCRMGADAMSVVGPAAGDGISGLRIADGSIMPPTASGNINASVDVIVESTAALAGR
jgi:choline dehydrogenase-like flavoprotein